MASARISTGCFGPWPLSLAKAPRPPSALLALGGFLVPRAALDQTSRQLTAAGASEAQNAALAEELGPSAIGWPLKALDKAGPPT